MFHVEQCCRVVPPVSFIVLMITGRHHYSLHGTVGHNTASQGWTGRATIRINHLALPDTLCGEYPENFMSLLRCLENEHSSSQKVTNATRSIFWKEEQDKSTKWKGSCVSTLIMVVCAITASARLIWENVFSPQIDRSRDGENPLNPAKMWSACWTSALDKNVPLSHTGAEQHRQQPDWAALHDKVRLPTTQSPRICLDIVQ